MQRQSVARGEVLSLRYPGRILGPARIAVLKRSRVAERSVLLERPGEGRYRTVAFLAGQFRQDPGDIVGRWASVGRLVEHLTEQRREHVAEIRAKRCEIGNRQPSVIQHSFSRTGLDCPKERS